MIDFKGLFHLGTKFANGNKNMTKPKIVTSILIKVLEKHTGIKNVWANWSITDMYKLVIVLDGGALYELEKRLNECLAKIILGK